MHRERDRETDRQRVSVYVYVCMRACVACARVHKCMANWSGKADIFNFQVLY